MENRRISLTLHRFHDTLAERLTEPLGLVAKGSTWYFVWKNERGLFQVDRVSDVSDADWLGNPVFVSSSLRDSISSLTSAEGASNRQAIR